MFWRILRVWPVQPCVRPCSSLTPPFFYATLPSTIDGKIEANESGSRFPSRHPGDVDPQDSKPRTESRRRNRSANTTDLRRCAQDWRRLALSGLAAPTDRRLPQGGVGRLGE